MTDSYLMGGETPSRVPSRSDLKPPLFEAWTAPSALGVVPDAPILAADGLLFAGDSKGKLVALDGRSGRRVWEYPWQGRAVLVDRGLLYFAMDNDELHLVDVRTGRPSGCLPGCGQSGAIASGSFLMTPRMYAEHPVPAVACTHLESGRRLWTFPLASDWSPRRTPLAAASGLLAVSRGLGDVHVLHLETGDVVWQRSWPEWGWEEGERFRNEEVSCLFAVEGRLVIAMGRHIMALSLETGDTIWQAEGGGQCYYDGSLYSVIGEDYEVRDARDGSVRSKREAARGAPRGISPSYARIVRVTDSHVFLATGSGILIAMDRATGAYSWSHHPKGASEIRGDVAIVSGLLYYRNLQRLFCLAPRG